MHFALLDNSCREYLFLADFFMVQKNSARDLFTAVFGKTLPLFLVSYVKELSLFQRDLLGEIKWNRRRRFQFSIVCQVVTVTVNKGVVSLKRPKRFNFYYYYYYFATVFSLLKYFSERGLKYLLILFAFDFQIRNKWTHIWRAVLTLLESSCVYTLYTDTEYWCTREASRLWTSKWLSTRKEYRD